MARKLPSENIPTLLKEGSRIASWACTVYYLTGGRGVFQVIVPQKAAPTAVDRHRIRRRIRSIVVGVGIPANTDVLIMARPSVLKSPYGRLKAECNSIISKINI